MIYYQRPVSLNRARHQNLRIEPLPDHFAFAAKTNALLLASTEIAEAMRDYPVVFAGQEGGPFTLTALVGLRDNENLLVDEHGRWDTNAYVPAVARRYPFVLAERPGDPVLGVCFDEAYAGLNEERGERLFDENGQESAYLKAVIEFLGAFHADMQRTMQFSSRLNELGLLVQRTVTATAPGAADAPPQVLNGVWVVDEEKMRALADAPALEIYRSGYMGWICGHLLSLRNFQRLAVRLGRMKPPVEEAAAPKRGRKSGTRTEPPRWNGSERRKNPR